MSFSEYAAWCAQERADNPPRMDFETEVQVLRELGRKVCLERDQTSDVFSREEKRRKELEA